MQNSTFHGLGKILHTDTGHVFEGHFENGYKHGPATFKLKNHTADHGVFTGTFEFNSEVKQLSNYGKRY